MYSLRSLFFFGLFAWRAFFFIYLREIFFLLNFEKMTCTDMPEKFFSEQIIEFYRWLATADIKTPAGVDLLNPYAGLHAQTVSRIVGLFFEKYYRDQEERTMIIGINPGRFGAGNTGIMFTDTIRLNQDCRIEFQEFRSHELSSEFVYRVINAYGGPQPFYRKFYITAVSPLGFVKNLNGRKTNLNYYDSPEILNSALPFIENAMLKQMQFRINRQKCICLGIGKNFEYLTKLNSRLKLFEKVIPVDHPRFIMQYRRKKLDEYVKKYLDILNEQ